MLKGREGFLIGDCMKVCGQKADVYISHIHKCNIEKLVNAEELSKDLLNLLYFNCSFYFTVLKYKGLLYHTSESSKD